jgi:predicted nuclease with RNAse H fold
MENAPLHHQVGSFGLGRNASFARKKEFRVTTVDAPVSHLRENPFEIAREQLRKVAKVFAIDPNLVNVL